MRYEQTWDVLEVIVAAATYEDGARFVLHRDDLSNYCRLDVLIHQPNSYRGSPGDREDRFTRHEFLVPCATYTGEVWTRWIYERLLTVARHEVGEWFKVAGVRVYPPYHGNGEDPYLDWTGGSLERASKAPGDD